MKAKRTLKKILLYLSFSFIGAVMVFPFIWMVATSFKTGAEVYSLKLIPSSPTWENYVKVLKGSDFPKWFFNSFLIAGITTVSVLIFDPLLGFAFC